MEDLGFERRQAPFYSGNVENIRRLLSQIGIGNQYTDTLTEEFVEVRQGEVDDKIDAKLRVAVPVPLTPITRNGRTGFPGIIQNIASTWVAKLINDTEFTEVEPNRVSASIESMFNRAMIDFDNLVNGLLVGSVKLEGQRIRAKNRYVSPTAAPVSPMKPYIGGRTPAT